MPKIFKRRGFRRLVFTVFTVAIGLIGLETAARIWEINHPGPPVEARSLLPFQALPEEPLLSSEDAVKPGFRYLASGDWPGLGLAIKKPPNEIRIVLLGGSQALGYGVAMPANFGRVLERLLNKAASGRRVRVINLSRIGWASPQHAANLARNIADLAPDLVLTVMGNNEFLDVHAAGKAEKIDRLREARWLETRSALARLLRPRLKKPEAPPMQKPPESIVKNSPARAFVQDRLARSLKQIIETARASGAQTLVCTVSVNLRFMSGSEWYFAEDTGQGPGMGRDFLEAQWALRYGAPEKAVGLMRARLTKNEKDYAARWILAQALTQQKQPDQARAEDEAIAGGISPDGIVAGRFGDVFLRTAGVCATRSPEECRQEAARWRQSVEDAPLLEQSFALWKNAELDLLAGNAIAARENYQNAISIEPNPFRADESINSTLMNVARDSGAAAFDLAAEVARRSPEGIPGFEWFLDYCHFNPRGHILVGSLIAHEAARILKIKGALPHPETLLAKEFELRRGRETDVPDWEWWAGADFDPTLLVRGMVDGDRHPFEEILRYMKEHGESALGRTFIGNWLTYHPVRSQDDIGGGRDWQYRRALELDPNFAAARQNMEFFATVVQRSWSPPVNPQADNN